MMQDFVKESFPIRTVSEMTGVNAVTLRAWERRYGLISPERTPKGHRLYTQDHIDKIDQILDRLAQGMSIGQVARELKSIEASVNVNGESNTWNQYIQRMTTAVTQFDERKLESVYNEAMSLYPVEIITSRLILPLLKILGRRWQESNGSVAEEHFFSVYLRNKLGARFHHQNLANNGPKLIMACLPGELHEFGILLFALTAHNKGYQVVLLGADLPVADLAEVASRTDSAAIVLAGSSPLDCKHLLDDIHALTDMVSIPVYIGGGVAVRCRDHIDRTNAIALTGDFSSSLYAIEGSLNNYQTLQGAKP